MSLPRPRSEIPLDAGHAVIALTIPDREQILRCA
jgi:hypothetical protein